MDKRIGKQLLFGIGFLALILLIIFGSYFLWFKPAPSCFDNRQNQDEIGVDCGGVCESCDIRTLTLPETTSEIKTFSSDGKTIAIAEIKNPNLNWGASQISYDLNIYDNDGNKMDTIYSKTFIYAGETKSLVIPIEASKKNISRLELVFSDPIWKSKDEFGKPEIQTRGIQTSFDSNLNRLSITGTIDNKNPYNLSKTIISGLVYNAAGILIGVSKTETENINSFGSFSFKISFPTGLKLKSAPKASFNKNLSVGSTGADVKNLQDFLKESGVFTGTPSTTFGPATKAALINYQKQNKLTATGSFDLKTRTFVNAVIAQKNSPLLNEVDPEKTTIYIEAIK